MSIAPLRKHERILRGDTHRAWRSWRIVGWLASKAYVLGIAAGTSASYNHECNGCTRLYLRGRRIYILGVTRGTWRCWLKYHHRRGDHIGLDYCAKELPCPDCGSQTAGHEPTCWMVQPVQP